MHPLETPYTIKGKYIEFNCHYCGRLHQSLRSNLKRRRFEVLLCRSCARSFSHWRKYRQSTRDALLARKYLTYEEYMLDAQTCKGPNIEVRFTCAACGIEHKANAKQLSKRTVVNSPLCPNCVMKSVTSSRAWREKNSDSQKKIQSTAEQKRKNAEGVSRFWREHPEQKRIMAQHVKETFSQPEVRERWRKSLRPGNRGLVGTLRLKNGQKIRFESSYELCFLFWIESRYPEISIRRCNFLIPYTYEGRTKIYIPDFLLVYKGWKGLFEIKSLFFHHFDLRRDLAKQDAAAVLRRDRHIDVYVQINENTANNLGIELLRSQRIKPLCKLLHNQKRIAISNRLKAERYIGTDAFKEEDI